MIQISKNEFLQMFSLGILNGNKKELKEFTVTSRKKPASRKKHYVHEAHYSQYLRAKNNNDNKINNSII